MALAALPSLAARILPDAVARFAGSPPRRLDPYRGCPAWRCGRPRRFGTGPDYGFSVEPDNQDELRFTPLVRDKFVAILRQEDPLAGQSRLTWERLLAEPLVNR